jgi:hypothetical protein
MKSWTSLERDMANLLEKIKNAPLFSRDEVDDQPRKGIYVFYENGKPIYVGRSNRLKGRILEHGRPSSTHNSAPFAFNIAKERAKRAKIDTNKSRGALEKEGKFGEMFRQAKERVAKMQVRVLRLDDQVYQTIFEVYASLQLKTTRYNSFHTH